VQAIGISGPSDNLRASLRGATAAAHDILDHAMRAASGWASQGDYLKFLTLQHSARRPVEAWLAQHCEASSRPPAQCDLIAHDLADMGYPVPPDAAAFDPGTPEVSGSYALGAAWVLAGSSLGNRAILKEMQRVACAEGAPVWPHAFLSDEAMLTYWKDLRGRIERPAAIEEVAAASSAAAAVFDHFLAATSGEGYCA
jgi:heme oxygenase